MSVEESVKTYYTGGVHPAGSDTPRQLPVSNIKAWSAPEGYVAGKDLIAAVNVAITLGRPLLVTGEPGTGKSDLAKSVAYDLGLGDPLEFIVKSDTESRDLFYSFDTVGRFHASKVDANGSALEARVFISYNALGEAILRANDPATVARYRRDGTAHERAQRSVVLIDEVDKAPRDVPNDLLSEIDRLEFEIPELSQQHGRPVKVKADDAHRPIVIITSNLEKSLPDAFLRRCVYYHMAFPEREVLEKIVGNRLGARYRENSAFVASALSLFGYLREPRLGLSKPPATAELLDWLYVLFHSIEGKPPEELAKHPRFLAGVQATLLKNQSDRDRAQELTDGWKNSAASTARSG